ncbi:MAG TPA: cytochrome c peroxidase [Xanthobacteraceae bacterium]|nr:cytochrome c peroxidase [Xanthobacteraceae bacterium]
MFSIRHALATLVAGWIAGIGAAGVYLGVNDRAAEAAASLAQVQARYRRPETIPFPADNAFSEEKRALGEALFHDSRLSVDGNLSCASCHERSLGFADGVALTKGVPGRQLKRHTPTLWNLAYGADTFWDGRARTLEEQATGPITNPDEMAMPMERLVALLAADPAMTQAFAKAFPADPQVTDLNIARALATYQRTFVSPQTRFDRWVEGEDGALTGQEIAGFALFNGKAGCANCHSGPAFTDSAFHDIGLPGDDRGRGAVLQLPAADHAFKTPGLRELGRSAPYMHDGSLATLADVVRHYQSGIAERDSLSKDLPRGLVLTEEEQQSLVAFLHSLTAETDPELPSRIAPALVQSAAPAVRITTVSQDNKTFHPGRIAVERGARVWIVNNDTRTHNVRIFNPALKFDSGAQEPGETIQVSFPEAGSFLVFCGLHPKMELRVEVAP